MAFFILGTGFKGVKIEKYRLVYVEWQDSYGCGSSWGDIPPDKDPTAHHCYSVGWVVAENEECIVIVPHLSPENKDINADEQGCGDMTIPKVAVKEIRDIT